MIVIHHSGKDAKSKSRGASGFTNDPDAVLTFDYHKPSGIVTVTVEKMRGGPAGFTKGFRVKQVPYIKPHKKTGEPVTQMIPIVEPIPDAEWAQLEQGKTRSKGAETFAATNEPKGLTDFDRVVFEALRELDLSARQQGSVNKEFEIAGVLRHIHNKEGSTWDSENDAENDNRKLRRRLLGKPLWSCIVKTKSGSARMPYAFKLPEYYRDDPEFVH